MKTYYSHKGKLLRDHLIETAEMARRCLDHPAFKSGPALKEVAYLCGLCHDLGKFTDYFQDHLFKNSCFEGGLEYHAFLSATLGALIVQERLSNLPNIEYKEYLPLLAFIAIHRHHGNLRNPRDIIPSYRDLEDWPDITKPTGELKRALEALLVQLDNLSKNQDNFLPEIKKLNLEEIERVLDNRSIIKELFNNLDKLRYRYQKMEIYEGMRLAIWEQLLFSALIESDKLSASGLELPERKKISPTIVNDYVEDNFSQPKHRLDRLRGEFYRKVNSHLNKLLMNENFPPVLSLTAPTGMGKTIVALNAAIRLRDKLSHKWGDNHAPRIIYALPYVNIIEQNFSRFENILSKEQDYTNSPHSFLLKHHHLSEISYRCEGKELELDKALSLVESWESEIVVTTFVQVFNTLIIGNTNRTLKKLHNLIGSILILDEIQAIPMEYWHAVNKIIRLWASEIGFHVIQMTATRPVIFSDDPPPLELFPEAIELFKMQNRTRLDVDLEDHEFEEIVNEISDLIVQSGSAMVVVNTISMSLRIYNYLKDRLEGFSTDPSQLDGKVLTYLSTNLTPIDRKNRIEQIYRRLSSGKSTVVIATQVIEAGVDLDFPTVFREIGPMDSIIQVAGRCNREGTRDKGVVLIRSIKGSPVSKVYGAIHLSVTRKLLKDSNSIDESLFLELVNRYFIEAIERKADTKSRDLIQSYGMMKFDQLVNFQMIEDLPKILIFIPKNEDDENWFKNSFVKEVLEEPNPRKRREAWMKYRMRFRDRVVEILKERAVKNLPPLVSEYTDLRWVPIGQLDRFYDPEYGFKWLLDESDSMAIY